MSGIIGGVGSRSGIIGSTEIPGGYEDGAWTPATTSFGLTIQAATYTRIGDRCFVNCRVVSDGAGAGSAGFTGLPFTIDGDHIGTVLTHLIDWDSGTSLGLYLENNQTKAVIYLAGDNIAWTNQTTFAVNETIIFTCSYKIK